MLSRRAAWLLFVPVLLVLVGYVLFPSLQTFALGLGEADWGDLFASPRAVNARALINSVLVSLYTVAGAGVLGTALAYGLFRFDLPLRRVMMALAAFPLALPPLVGVLAFAFLYGESGILPRGLQRLFELDAVPFSFRGLGAVWLVHVYSLYVYFYLFVLAALRGVDRSLLEASADLGATGWTTFRRAVLPLLRPITSQLIVTEYDAVQDLPVASHGASELAAAALEAGFQDVITEPDKNKAYERLVGGASKLALITGSFYLISQLRQDHEALRRG